MDGTQFLTVQQAAAHFGVTEKTIRRRIADGKLNAEKVPTSQGYEWRITVEQLSTVQVDNTSVQLPGHEDIQPGGTSIHSELTQDAALLRALELAERLQQENVLLVNQNVQLAGQIGFMQAQLQAAQERIKLLTDAQFATAQSDPTLPLSEQPLKQVPWWKRLLGI